MRGPVIPPARAILLTAGDKFGISFFTPPLFAPACCVVVSRRETREIFIDLHSENKNYNSPFGPLVMGDTVSGILLLPIDLLGNRKFDI